MNKKDFVEKYTFVASRNWEASLNYEYKRENKYSKKLEKLFQKLKSRDDFGKGILSELLDSDNDNVRLWAASHSLRLGIHKSMAARVLKEIGLKDDLGELAFNAKITLSEIS